MITASLPEVLDLGNIEQGRVVENSFFITNKYHQDIEITKVSAGCGCTVPEARLGTLKATESMPIRFTFNTNGRTGSQNKSITVQYKIGDNPHNHFIKKFTAFIKVQ